MKKLQNKQEGFSLIEIAIVLVIIGVLAGAVVKGVALINDAKLSKAEQAIQSISTAYLTYLRSYSAPPGDDSVANERFNITNANGNGDTVISSEESNNAWLHLRNAGFMTGSGSLAPLHPWGSAYNLIHSVVFARNALCLNAVQGDQASILDNRLDDGRPNSGTIRSDNALHTAYDASTNYNVCSPL